MLNPPISSRTINDAIEQRAVVEKLLHRLAADREVVVAISNAVISVSDSNARSCAKAKGVVEDMQALVRRGVERILEALCLVENDLHGVSQFSEMLDFPIQDLIEAGEKLSASLQTYADEQTGTSYEPTDKLKRMLADQRELRAHLFKKSEVIIASSTETVGLLETLIDQLQDSFAKLSVISRKR